LKGVVKLADEKGAQEKKRVRGGGKTKRRN